MNLDAYLDRIDHTGPRTPSLPLLESLCARHSAVIPFENLDAFLGRTPRLDIATLEGKLVGQRRGGWCHEQNLLMREVLMALGFDVTALAARVAWMAPPEGPEPAATHMLLLARVPGETESFIVDVGFGGHLFGVPMAFDIGLNQICPMGLVRVRQDGAIHTVETQLEVGWAPIYRFTLAPQRPVDFEPLNWFTATHPGSLLRNNLRVERLEPGLRASLFNDRLVLRRPGQRPETRRVADAAELGRLLDATFMLTPPLAAAELFDRLPKGLDHPHLP